MPSLARVLEAAAAMRAIPIHRTAIAAAAHSMVATTAHFLSVTSKAITAVPGLANRELRHRARVLLPFGTRQLRAQELPVHRAFGLRIDGRRRFGFCRHRLGGGIVFATARLVVSR
jgi:hypothetical protein